MATNLSASATYQKYNCYVVIEKVSMIEILRFLAASIVMGSVILWPVESQSQTVIGIVDDGPPSRSLIPMTILEAEIQSLISGEFDVSLPTSKQLHGNWSRAGINEALSRLLNDPDVDLIIANGMVASSTAAGIENLSKPVLASVIADAQLQDVPYQSSSAGIVSGKPNFNYLTRVRLRNDGTASIEQTAIDEAIDVFHNAVDFRHLAVVVDQLTSDSTPELLASKSLEIENRLGAKTTIITSQNSVSQILEDMPADVDAVLIGPLLTLDENQLTQLADRFMEKKLPSFSLLGRIDVQGGLLMAFGHADDTIRYARRIALNVQRILLGEEASEIDVLIEAPQRLAINMRTAAAVGFAPRTALLLDAEQLYAGQNPTAEMLRINEAMAEALSANLALRASAMSPLVSRESTRIARSQLLPQFGIGTAAVGIDEDRAGTGIQPERSLDTQILGSMLVYSDDAYAAAQIASYIESASLHGYQVDVLNTLHAAASSYLAVLRARALESVQRNNLEVTRSNLELARLRQSIGTSGRADVLRWESQLATDRQNVVTASADAQVMLANFNQILNRSPNRDFSTNEKLIANTAAVFENSRFASLIDTSDGRRQFEDYVVSRALEHSPELLEANEFLAAQERQVLASKRKFYVPDILLSTESISNLDRGGVRSNLLSSSSFDNTWAVTLSASWPLFTSGALRSQLNRDRFTLTQIKRDRAALAQDLETRTRIALLRASGSFPTLEFSQEAAAAAAENLELVRQAYQEGATSVTALIDAQNASVSASLRATDARYAYLIDVVDLLRAISDFTLLINPGGQEQWFQELETYTRN